MHLLHIDSSARRSSFSRRLGREFRQVWSELSRDHTVTYRDLAVTAPPPIGEAWTEICDNLLRDQIVDLEELHRGARTARQREAWAIVEPLLDELRAADVILIGAPMYNFGVPASLKAWIDQVTFPKINLQHRRFVVVGARGGTYLAGTPREPVEHHTRYLADFFRGHFSVPATTVVVAELANSLVDPALAHLKPTHESSLEAAITAARQSARAHGAALAVAGP